ncbi:MAG: alkaline phosphatase, partial [Verrucomicrobiota bacterium]|nr:alkaline phosphatase [Verrucomicrobiota bacterium]
IDSDGKSLPNLFEVARESGRMTGLVTNALVTDPTSAAFFAHTKRSDQREELARSLAQDAAIDVVLGGGAADFLPIVKGGRRGDDLDLIQEMRGRGYDVAQSLEEFDAIPRWRRAKVFGFFAQTELAFSDEVERGADQPTLSDMVRRAIELLQFNSGGYVLVVDAALMGRAARENKSERTLAETVELDRAIAVAQRYAGTKSMIIVCGDVGIGGLNLNGSPPLGHEKGENEEVLPNESKITWATGPKGPHEMPMPVVEENGDDPITPRAAPVNSAFEQPAAVFLPAAQNSAGDVVAFGVGLGTDPLRGSLDNTAIFELIRDSF